MKPFQLLDPVEGNRCSTSGLTHQYHGSCFYSSPWKLQAYIRSQLGWTCKKRDEIQRSSRRRSSANLYPLSMPIHNPYQDTFLPRSNRSVTSSRAYKEDHIPAHRRDPGWDIDHFLILAIDGNDDPCQFNPNLPNRLNANFRSSSHPRITAPNPIIHRKY